MVSHPHAQYLITNTFHQKIMTEPSIPRWLQWAREIQALGQIGETFAENHWQVERNQRLMEIAAEIVSEHTALPVEPISQDFKAQPGYATPKVDVRGAVFRGDKLMLVRERFDDGWTMPGGWADIGDTPLEAVKREVWEESGFEVEPSRVVGIYDGNRVQPLELFQVVKLVFFCEIVGGQATPSEETSEIKFFSEDEVPRNLSGERTRPRHIRDAFLALQKPEMLTVFE